MKYRFPKNNTLAGEASSKRDCVTCRKSFKVYAYSLKKGQGKFCSIKCSAQARKGRVLSKEYCQRLSELALQRGTGKWMKGKVLSETWKTNIGKASSLRTHSLEARKKISESHKGEKSYMWQGGITLKNQTVRNSFEYKEWRKAVFERDGYTCQFCKQVGGDLNADHIKPFALFPDLRLDLENGRTLCINCHKKTDTWGLKLQRTKILT